MIKIFTKSAVEAQRAVAFIAQGKQFPKYKDGGNRFDARRQVSLNSAGSGWVEQDANMLFKTGNYLFSIPVHGKTNDYTVTIKVLNFLDKLNEALKTKQFSVPTFQQVLMQAMNSNDIQCSCTCLRADTLIKLLDGRDITIKQLADEFNQGKVNYVYSTDDKGDFVPTKVAWAGVTKRTRVFTKVTLDNNKEIYTTPDHRYRMRTGEYKQASELNVGDSLMPLYFYEGQKGYLLVKDNSSNNRRAVYKQVAKHYYSKEIADAENRAKSDRSYDAVHYLVAVHHKDFIKENNYPENLQPMTALEHWHYHANCSKEHMWETMSEEGKAHIMAHWNAMNSNPTPAMLEVRKKWNAAGVALNYTPRRKKQQSELMSRVISNYWATASEEQKSAHIQKGLQTRKLSGKGSGWHLSEEAKKNHSEITKKLAQSEQYRKKISEGVKRSYQNPELLAARSASSKKTMASPLQKRRMLEGRVRANLIRLIELKLPLTLENYEAHKIKQCPHLLNVFPEGIDFAVSYFELNHKVIAIEDIFLKTPEEVYDLTTEEETHNFLLSAGVIVHNCADYIFRHNYTATQNDNNAGRPETRPSPITNPTNQKGSCKHILYVLNNKLWATKVARTLFNYIVDIWKNKKQLFDRIIRPALNDITDEKILSKPEKPKEGPFNQPQKQNPAAPELDSQNKAQTEPVKESLQDNNLTERAISLFGVCYSPALAGYLMPDGKMLDFSAPAARNRRARDHRDVADLYPDLELEHISDYVSKFMQDTGAIRVDYKSSSIDIDISHEPTDAQYDKLWYFIDRGGSTSLDLSNGNTVVGSFYYEGSLSNKATILRDIKQFFATGHLPKKQSASEAINSFYQGRQQYDEDQLFALSVCKEQGADIEPYVTPENTPDQILELGTQYKLGLPVEILKELSDPSLSYRVIEIIATASRNKINLLPYKHFSPDALEQIVRGVKLKVPIEKIALSQFNSRQIEQLVRAYRIDPKLYEKICDYKISYNKMRDIIRAQQSSATESIHFSYKSQLAEVRSIIDSLTKEESEHIGDGYWIDSEHIIYRRVARDTFSNPIGFIDVYLLPKYPDVGCVVIAVKKEARGKGVAKKLALSAINSLRSSKRVKKLRWLVDGDNIVSEQLAKTLGFDLNTKEYILYL